MQGKRAGQAGFTLVELSLTLVIMSIVIVSMFSLFIDLVHSATSAKRRAVALTLATNQMEYLKSLPYDSLAIAGGSITGGTLPGSAVKTVSNVKYTVVTGISYVDDAYDGCGPYPNQTIAKQYCRNYPATGTPPTDGNPQDYKIAHVDVKNTAGDVLASVDTEISARVAETASATGALFVSVVDGGGNPVQGATVNVVDSTLSPVVNVSDTTDENGLAIFYGLKPDNGNDYAITASNSGYSTLATIRAAGSLQPTYPSQKILSQQASYVSLKLLPQGANSLLLETTDTSGNPLGGAKVYVKGGYKKYTSASDTQYYYDNDNAANGDNRPTTDGSGLAAISNLVPLNYIFCGDDGSVNCSVGGTKYYLAAAIPYTGTNQFGPIGVPPYDSSNPPATTFNYNGTNYLQKVRLMLTTNANLPRAFTLSPYEVSASAANLSSFNFTVGGRNLACSSNAASCATSVKLVQGGTTYTASCTGSSNGATAGQALNCIADLSGIASGTAQLVVSNSGGTLTLPVDPLLGGLRVTP